MRKFLRYTLGLLAAAFLVLLLLPSPIDPVSWTPPAAPALEGALALNERLREAEILAAARAPGPEDVAVDAAGRMYAGLADGRILRLTVDGGTEILETFAETGGRPLGLDFDPAGNLVVADGIRGLLSVDPAGRVTVLSTGADGMPFGFADDLDVASDGTVYFSDASSKYGPDSYLYDLLEARPHGRLLAYDPASGTTKVLLDDLYFANGIALSAAEDFVLVNETYRYRIQRYWLQGEKAGTAEIFADDLPGFPDGVSANGRGTFWVAMFTVRNPLMDRLHPRPYAKSLLAKLPRLLWPKPEPYGLVLALDESGRIREALHDPGGGHIQEITSAEEYTTEEGTFLYLGSLHQSRIGRLRLAVD